MALAEAAGATVLDSPFNFRDPWGSHLEIVAYRDVQFSKTEEARAELRGKLAKADLSGGTGESRLVPSWAGYPRSGEHHSRPPWFRADRPHRKKGGALGLALSRSVFRQVDVQVGKMASYVRHRFGPLQH